VATTGWQRFAGVAMMTGPAAPAGDATTAGVGESFGFAVASAAEVSSRVVTVTVPSSLVVVVVTVFVPSEADVVDVVTVCVSVVAGAPPGPAAAVLPAGPDSWVVVVDVDEVVTVVVAVDAVPGLEEVVVVPLPAAGWSAVAVAGSPDAVPFGGASATGAGSAWVVVAAVSSAWATRSVASARPA
jgi:hypothetical protein